MLSECTVLVHRPGLQYNCNTDYQRCNIACFYCQRNWFFSNLLKQIFYEHCIGHMISISVQHLSGEKYNCQNNNCNSIYTHIHTYTHTHTHTHTPHTIPKAHTTVPRDSTWCCTHIHAHTHSHGCKLCNSVCNALQYGEARRGTKRGHSQHSWHIIVTYPLKNNNYTDTISREIKH